MHYFNYLEKRNHGRSDFSMQYYHVNVDFPRYVMPPHWHRESELVYVRSGSLHIRVNGVEKCLTSGEFCYIGERELHSGIPVDCEYECVVFNPKLLFQGSQIKKSLKEIEGENTRIFTFFDSREKSVSVYVEGLISYLREKKAGCELGALSSLLGFYAAVAAEGYYVSEAETVRIYKKMEPIKASLEYIEKNYDRRITLGELSEVSGLSPKYFCRCFKNAMDRTPIDYLNYYRIERACELLEGECTVTEAAYKCGFCDSSYFVCCFKKYKKTTPKKYVNR